MTKNLLTSLLLLFSIFTYSQNLVPNHSFENYDSSYNATIYPYFNHTYESIEDWRTEWNMFNTPDFFFQENYLFFDNIPSANLQNVISLYNTGLGVNYASEPINYAGVQSPRTGTKYIGLRSETPNVLNSFNQIVVAPYHEYIQVKLTQALEENKSYQVSFYVSLTENNLLQNNTIAGLLSQDSILELGVSPIQPSISSTAYDINNEEWTQVVETYTAQGGEEFITLGNLTLNNLTDTFILPGQFNSIYYYIDYVSVFENKTLDTTLCPNSSITLNASQGSTNHLWQDGSTDSIFIVNEPGVYWYRGNFDNISHTDTFNISYYEPLIISTIADTKICYNDSIELSATHNFSDVQYNWSTGDTTSTIFVSDANLYTLTIKNICEKQDAIIIINEISEIELELGNETVLCNNEVLILSPQNNDGQYNWQDGSEALTYSVNSTGQYWLSITNECERISDTINVQVKEKLELELGPDFGICEFPITIDVFDQGANYLWHDNSQNNFITIDSSSTIWVNVSNECESLYDTIKINHFCGCEIYIPNTFTPNNDNINDYFDIKIDPQCPLKRIEFFIYNRWGDEVFYSDNINTKWNGYYKNKLAQNGAYVYSVNYQFFGEPRKRIIGKVILKN